MLVACIFICGARVRSSGMPGPTTVKSSIERTVEVKFELAQQGDFVNLLGIDPGDDQETIRQAYLRWIKLVHPDNLARNGIGHLRDKASVVFKALSEAHEVFSDDERRMAYLSSLDGDVSGQVAAEIAKVQSRNAEEEAKIALHQARLLLRRRAWDDAETLLRQFIATYPTDSRALTLLGWCILQNDTDKPERKRAEEAKTFWQAAIKADAENADAHYHLSLYFKLTGNHTQQERSLKRAVKLDRSHVAAQREMRLLEMRKSNTDEDAPESMGDFFKRIWKRLNKKVGKDEPEKDPKKKKK